MQLNLSWLLTLPRWSVKSWSQGGARDSDVDSWICPQPGCYCGQDDCETCKQSHDDIRHFWEHPTQCANSRINARLSLYVVTDKKNPTLAQKNYDLRDWTVVYRTYTEGLRPQRITLTLHLQKVQLRYSNHTAKFTVYLQF